MDPQVKVWLGGEGSSEIGDRERADGKRVGAIEALLRKVEHDGWHVAGAVRWRHIKKFTVGAARGRSNHGDIHSIAGLVNMAYEAGCPVVAFTRDVDADPERADAIRRGIEHARNIPHLRNTEIIGGPAEPALEGWILALLGVRDTEAMSRQKANRLLDERDLGGKHAECYMGVIENPELRLASDADLARLPPGCAALKAWLRDARSVLSEAVRER